MVPSVILSPTHSLECIANFGPPPEHIQGVIGGQALPEQQQYPVAIEGAAGGVVLPEQPVYPMDGAVGGAYDQHKVEEFRSTMSRTMDGDHISKFMDEASILLLINHFIHSLEF